MLTDDIRAIKNVLVTKRECDVCGGPCIPVNKNSTSLFREGIPPDRIAHLVEAVEEMREALEHIANNDTESFESAIAREALAKFGEGK